MSGEAAGTRVTPGGWTVADRGSLVVCVATSTARADRESTFIKDHMARLPARVTVLAGLDHPPRAETGELVAPTALARLGRAALRRLLRLPLSSAQDAAIARHLRRRNACAVLAEYGPTAHRLIAACRLARLPLVAHFHGYDASVTGLVERHGGYAELFASAAAVVAVSRDLERRLRELGAPPERLHYSPYGVDTTRFAGGDPAGRGPTFVAVGRFVEKKAPELTLLAFRKVHAQDPTVRLVMIGDGPLLGPCERIARALGLSGAVAFPGSRPPEAVAEALRGARAFVQHSLRARDGDSEGTPVALLEATATGLPVVATGHGGIKDVVVEGETGFLVEEEDVDGMAERMGRLANDALLAARLGAAGRRRAETLFSADASISRLWDIIRAVMVGRKSG